MIINEAISVQRARSVCWCGIGSDADR